MLLLLVGVAAAGIVSFVVARSIYATKIAALKAVAEHVAGRLEEGDAQMAKLRGELAEEAKARAIAENTLSTERESLAQQKRTLDDAEAKLTSAFEGLAGKVLADNTATFLRLADTTLKAGAIKDLGDLVEPLGNTLVEYKKKLEAIEESRLTAYTALSTTLNSVGSTQETLRRETSNLVNALRRPNVRGRWGELTLKRVAELTGMTDHCDFELHVHVEGEEGDLSPDMLVHLPKDMIVPVDSKVPFDSYLDAIGTTDAEQQKDYMKRHAAALRNRMRKLASKEYEKQFRVTPDVTVLFVPSETFLSAALEYDPTLLEDAMQKKVALATPVTLFCLLKSVAYGWQQEAIAKNAQEISDLGRQLYERIQSFCGNLDELRKGLARANEGFDAAVRSLNSKVIPGARKFKELAATTGTDLEEIEPLEHQPRLLPLASTGTDARK